LGCRSSDKGDQDQDQDRDRDRGQGRGQGRDRGRGRGMDVERGDEEDGCADGEMGIEDENLGLTGDLGRWVDGNS